jgi:hypothetical protein
MTFSKNRGHNSCAVDTSLADTDTSPFREYVASMAAQLAVLARSDGDERLALALEGAAAMAREAESGLV